jgi:hypothetical protein
MDVSIGQLRLVGRVVATDEVPHRSAVVDLLTGPTAQRHLLDALTPAFEGKQVVVIRSLACTATVRPDRQNGPAAFAGSVAASAARLLRDHPVDDDCVVRFADETVYVAAYVHDYLEGRHDRWYYEVFRLFRGSDGLPDLAALLASRPPAVRWRVLGELRRWGDLDRVLTLVGEEGACGLLAATQGAGIDWSALAATAVDIVRRTTGRDARASMDAVMQRLAGGEPPPDWRDARSLGGAVAVATAAFLGALGIRLGEEATARACAAAQEHAWFDTTAFADALATRHGADHRPTEMVVDPVLSPRSRQVLGALARAAADPHLVLDPARPASRANLVRLLAALVAADERWVDDHLARELAGQVLDRWAQRTRSRHPELPRPTSASFGSREPGGSMIAPSGGERIGLRDGEPPSREQLGPSAGSVAEQLDLLFPQAQRGGAASAAPSAAGLLLLRGALDLGLAPYLLDTTASGCPLVSALLDRWCGLNAGGDALHSLVAELAGSRGAGTRLRAAAALAAQRSLALGTVAEPVHSLSVPYGTTRMVRVAADRLGRVLPWATLGGVPDLHALVADAGVGLEDETDDAALRTRVSDALAAVHLVTETSDEPELDLLAVCCVQAWARWLPGFGGASVPFLLQTMVRRPAAIDVTSHEVTVLLPARPYDVVLTLSGYLEPLEAGPTLAGRRVVFVMGAEDG